MAIFGEIFHRALIIIYAEKRKISMKERWNFQCIVTLCTSGRWPWKRYSIVDTSSRILSISKIHSISKMIIILSCIFWVTNRVYFCSTNTTKAFPLLCGIYEIFSLNSMYLSISDENTLYFVLGTSFPSQTQSFIHTYITPATTIIVLLWKNNFLDLLLLHVTTKNMG